MRIAIVAPFFDFSRSVPGGAIGDTIRHMAGESVYKDAIRIFAPYVQDPYPDLNLDMYPASLEGRALVAFLAERLRLYRPDIVEAHNVEREALDLSRRFPWTPFFLHSHSLPAFRRHSLWNETVRPLWLKRVIGVSDAARDRYRAMYPWHRKRIITIRNAIPVGDRRGGIKGREKLILFAARAGDYKGLGEFAEGCAKSLRDLADWQAAILTVEDRYSDPALREETQARFGGEMGARCQWIQNVPTAEVSAWMKRAAIFAAPSKCEEAFSLSVLEAHLGGAAVISSGRGGMREVGGEEGALYLKEVSAEAVAAAILRLAKNDEERQALAKRGQDYVLKHHRIEDRAKELDALREKILSAPRWRQRPAFQRARRVAK